MEFGILFTSHPNTEAEPYPHRDVHRRVTQQIVRADQLGFDYAWIAEHHFSNEYGIMPDVFVYAGYLAALTKRIKIGTAVVTLPLANPLRVVENTAFVDILSNGRFALGLGSGYRMTSKTRTLSWWQPKASSTAPRWTVNVDFTRARTGARLGPTFSR